MDTTVLKQRLDRMGELIAAVKPTQFGRSVFPRQPGKILANLKGSLASTQMKNLNPGKLSLSIQVQV
jgi:hypothetical protein